MSTASDLGVRDVYHGRPITVVGIDDHKLVAESVAAILNCANDVAVVAVAHTGAEGVAEVLRHQPDVLLLDQRLPDGLGTDLLPALKQSSPRTRVVLLTGSDSEDVLRRALEGGCAGVVAKDRRAAVLLEAVRGAAEGKTVFAADDLRRLLPRLVYPQSGREADLTRREHEVLTLLVDGGSTASIAQHLVISLSTARNHIQSIISKLGAHSKLEAVAIALREGIVAAP
jgi:DNA-binding NarL/FixJ family response regulator